MTSSGTDHRNCLCRNGLPSNRRIWWHQDTLVMLLSNLTLAARPSSNQTKYTWIVLSSHLLPKVIYAWAGNWTTVSRVAGKNSTTEPLMRCPNCETTQSWRWRRPKDTPSRAANNAVQHKSGMKQPCQFSLWRATTWNHSEPLNKERLESSCLRQDGIVCQQFLFWYGFRERELCSQHMSYLGSHLPHGLVVRISGFHPCRKTNILVWGPAYAVPSDASHLCQFDAVWTSKGKAKISLREQRLQSSCLKTSCLSCGDTAQW